MAINPINNFEFFENNDLIFYISQVRLHEYILKSYFK